MVAILSEMLVILLLIVGNGVFSGAEIAVVSLRHTRLRQLVNEKRRGATALAALRSMPERFIATVQIGITVLSATAAALGGAESAHFLRPLLERIPWVGQRAESLSFALVVAFISYLTLVLGELVPKSLALRSGQVYALLVARPLLALAWLARPLVWLLTASSNLVLRPFSDRTNFAEVQMTREELHQMVDEAAAAGAVDAQTGELASRALEFDRLTLQDVMIPRNRIDALAQNASLQEIHRFLLEERRSRVPVYDGSLDNVIGYVSAKDVVSLAWEGKLVVLHDILRPVAFFPETMLAVEVLRSMRREHHRIAMAVDEHGVLSGLVTFEDMMEELVGNVFSEREEGQPAIARTQDGSALVLGETPIRDVNRELGLHLEAPDEVSTMAGLCIALAGGMPHRRARLAASDGSVLVILDASVRTVRRVRVIPPPRPAA